MPGLAPLVACTSQERDSFLRLGGREKESAVQARGLAAGLVDRAKVFGMEGERHFQRLGQVLQQMKAVSDLHRRRGTPTRPLGVSAGAVACDHRDTGMRAQPRRERVRLAIGQQRHRTAALQIHQHSTVSGALAQAQSSTPRADGVTAGGTGACRTRRSSVLRLAANPSLAPRRTPALPPSAKPKAVSRASRRRVRRAQGSAIPGRRSVKMQRSQRLFRQN